MPSVEAIELMLQSGMQLACEHLTRPLPMPDPHGAYLLAEAAGDAPQEDILAEAVADLDGVEDALLADDAAGRASLWALREGHSVAVASTGIPPHKLDVTLQPGAARRVHPPLRAGGRGARPVLPRLSRTGTSATATCTST